MSLDFDDHNGVGETLLGRVRPDILPEELFREVQMRHPDATKQEIVHAAFRSVIDSAFAYDYERALLLQKFAFEAQRY